MNQKLILLSRKEQRGRFLDAKKSAPITSQSPFFRHYSTGAGYFKSNSKLCFSRHMLPCTCGKVVKIRQCKIHNKPCLAAAIARKKERALTCRILGQRLCKQRHQCHQSSPAFLLPILGSCSFLTVSFFWRITVIIKLDEGTQHRNVMARKTVYKYSVHVHRRNKGGF